MLDSMLLWRYAAITRPEPLRWKAWSDDHWNRAWSGMARFEARDDVLGGPLTIAQIGLVCVLGYADFRFADCGWRKAYPKLDKFHRKMLERPSVKISVPPAAYLQGESMNLFSVGDLTIHRIIEQETTFLQAHDM